MSGWSNKPAPRDGSVIIATGSVTLTAEEGGYSNPFCGEIMWNADFGGWVYSDTVMAVAVQADEIVNIHWWSRPPGNSEGAHPHYQVSTGSALIESERLRQIHEEGWTAEEDDGYLNDELLKAAICYVQASTFEGASAGNFVLNTPALWPWMGAWWKPSIDDPIRNLVKAGALIAADVDRRLRAAEKAERRAQ